MPIQQASLLDEQYQPLNVALRTHHQDEFCKYKHLCGMIINIKYLYKIKIQTRKVTAVLAVNNTKITTVLFMHTRNCAV